MERLVDTWQCAFYRDQGFSSIQTDLYKRYTSNVTIISFKISGDSEVSRHEFDHYYTQVYFFSTLIQLFWHVLKTLKGLKCCWSENVIFFLYEAMKIQIVVFFIYSFYIISINIMVDLLQLLINRKKKHRVFCHLYLVNACSSKLVSLYFNKWSILHYSWIVGIKGNYGLLVTVKIKRIQVLSSIFVRKEQLLFKTLSHYDIFDYKIHKNWWYP